MTNSAGIDPIRLELIKNALDAIVDEMAIALMRSAYSTNIKTAMDMSSALCDAQGRLNMRVAERAERRPAAPFSRIGCALCRATDHDSGAALARLALSRVANPGSATGGTSRSASD